MIYLIIGTQNSGKSALAEELSVSTGDEHRIYLATMKVYDEDGLKRIEKHRKQREGKGFFTIEKEYGIAEVLDEIESPKATTVLLECVSNLVGNEMYENPEWRDILKSLDKGMHIEKGNESELVMQTDCNFPKEDMKDMHETDCDVIYSEFADAVTKEIRELSEKVNNMIIVTNEYDADEKYDWETRLYLKLLGMVNERVSSFADKIYNLRCE
ncbi:bifunctional adenosylcobinamide kinase/adenosylcobinamide-phosphate guanylyltransferase [Butyrivibrio sp. VCB2006]|uniref:bifunctional adenosylcobinamide kinase/adenosylcobinamide-phosphate guanylyltransferase n=1 Tax=Butyrivibrio sp. VCB2006 TaxID=1280679 RepID=UPI00041637DB|nr:bifunctional adenosylcobinamide kinase/adenosylcobinamide-phosphate guanylyltransferase [Butyrivibrio sp. VCB2006]